MRRAGWRTPRCRRGACAGAGRRVGEPLLERDELAARVVHEGEEEQAVVGVVAAPQERDAAGARRGDADVRVGREPVSSFGFSKRRVPPSGAPVSLSRPMICSCSGSGEGVPAGDRRGCRARRGRCRRASRCDRGPDPHVAVEVERAAGVDRARRGSRARRARGGCRAAPSAAPGLPSALGRRRRPATSTAQVAPQQCGVERVAVERREAA